MNRRLASQLLKFFPTAPLPSKVVIAAALYAASKGELSEEEKEQIREMWAKAVKAEIEVEYIADLYAKGVADYTSVLKDYSDIALFISMTLARALK